MMSEDEGRSTFSRGWWNNGGRLGRGDWDRGRGRWGVWDGGDGGLVGTRASGEGVRGRNGEGEVGGWGESGRRHEY